MDINDKMFYFFMLPALFTFLVVVIWSNVLNYMNKKKELRSKEKPKKEWKRPLTNRSRYTNHCTDDCYTRKDTDGCYEVVHCRNCIQNRTPWYKLKEYGGVI